MTTVFDDTPKYQGLTGAVARVTCIEDRVLIRAVDAMAEEAVTIAMSPDQARALAAGLGVAANDAEGDESKAGWLISFDDLRAIRAAAGDWGYGIDLEAVDEVRRMTPADAITALSERCRVLEEEVQAERSLSDRLAGALEYIDDYALSYPDLGALSAVAQPAIQDHADARAALTSGGRG